MILSIRLKDGEVRLIINEKAASPMYFQVRERLLTDLNNEEYSRGDQLPTETELCQIYGVSKITIRRAVSLLVEEGILSRQQGKGTYVTNKKIKNEVISVGGFSEYKDNHHSRVLSSSIIKASAEEAAMIGVPQGDPILRLNRLIYIEDVPLVIDYSYYSQKKFPDLEKFIGESMSTYAILKKKYSVEPVSQERTIDVVFATKEKADLLKLGISASLFKMEKTVYDANDCIIHSSLLYMPTSKVTLTVQRGSKK
jgi:GntR family frlABCD operon transcriptional regulator